jgi:hypothetical protein
MADIAQARVMCLYPTPQIGFQFGDLSIAGNLERHPSHDMIVLRLVNVLPKLVGETGMLQGVVEFRATQGVKSLFLFGAF